MSICQFCGKSGFKQFKNHVRQCPKNPDASPSHRGHSGANQFTKGLSTNHSEETKKKISEKSSGFRHSEETKRKLSEIRIKFLKEHPEKVPYLLNHSSTVSYPEKYFSGLLEGCNLVHQYQVFRYKLDFANVQEKRYLEIDGDQHYLDKRIVEHDIKRTEKLRQIGWEGMRVRWSHYQKKSKEEKEKIVKEIKEFLGA